MDEMGIDIQVMYPTIFIQQITDKPEFEVPICKSYNRWMADIWRQSQGRLRWVCALPLLSMPDAWICCLGARNMAPWPFSCVRLKQIG